jgi:hypothetical protein
MLPALQLLTRALSTLLAVTRYVEGSCPYLGNQDRDVFAERNSMYCSAA